MINKNFDIDKTLKIKISTENDEKIFDTTIINKNNNRYGLKLNNLNTNDIKFIHKIINNRSDRYKI